MFNKRFETVLLSLFLLTPIVLLGFVILRDLA